MKGIFQRAPVLLTLHSRYYAPALFTPKIRFNSSNIAANLVENNKQRASLY